MTDTQQPAPPTPADLSGLDPSGEPSGLPPDAPALDIPLYSDDELVDALEAVIFASGDPLTLLELKKIFARLWADAPEEIRNERLEAVKAAVERLSERWQNNGSDARGFRLYKVAEGFTFRSNPRWADAVRAMREQRPVRLSKAALECLSVVAYRQPVTKPEIDHIRGVDCGSTLKILLDRLLVRIVGKKEEPGRPLLYGTSKEFLSFFNLQNLAQLPTLRDVQELSTEAQEELAAFDGVTLEELSQQAKKLRLDEEPAVLELDQAVQNLTQTETQARDALASQGLALEEQVAEAAPAEGAVGEGEPVVEGAPVVEAEKKD